MPLHEGERHQGPGAETNGESDRSRFASFRPGFTEAQIVPDMDLGDLDRGAFGKFLRARRSRTEEEAKPPTDADMQNFGLAREHLGERFPTLYGLLAFGRTPQFHRYMKSFVVRCAAYAGEDRGTEVILAGEAEGRLDEQVTRALGWFRSLGWREKYDGILREDIPRLPPEALREALVNAVAHRDYAIVGSAVLLDVFPDRAEITSPGTLPNHLTVEAVRAGAGPRSRNERIANLFVEARLMEKRGRGWFVMRDAMRDFNGTEPEILTGEGLGFVRVTLRFYAPGTREDAGGD